MSRTGAEEEEDLQFLRDLEEAKRQSLDSFKSECISHNSNTWWTTSGPSTEPGWLVNFL